MNPPGISIIIAATSGPDRLAVCLDSLAHQDTRHPLELVLADDGVTSETLSIARAFGCRILSQPGKGSAAARNLAASASVGEILVFISTELEPEEDFLDGLARPLTDTGVQACTGEACLFQRSSRRRAGRRRATSQPASLLAIAVKKDAFWEAGGFDETIADEQTQFLDLYHRLGRRGIQIASNPDARAWLNKNQDSASAAASRFTAARWAGRTVRSTSLSDIRQALSAALLAWDCPGIVEAYWEGPAALLSWPAQTLLFTAAYWTGLLNGIFFHDRTRVENGQKLDTVPRLKLVVVDGTLTAEKSVLHRRKAA